MRNLPRANLTVPRRVRTISLFVQLMTKHVLGVNITIDGSWSSATEAALVRLCDELDQSHDLDDVENWQRLLLACAACAFELATPSDMLVAEGDGADRVLQGVYAIIGNELAGSPGRKVIETALTGFVAHPKIRAALKKA